MNFAVYSGNQALFMFVFGVVTDRVQYHAVGVIIFLRNIFGGWQADWHLNGFLSIKLIIEQYKYLMSLPEKLCRVGIQPAKSPGLSQISRSQLVGLGSGKVVEGVNSVRAK